MMGNYVTAEQCRTQAESWENEEIKKCMRECCEEIWKQACRGGLKANVRISKDKPIHFYETLVDKMHSLGFEVIKPENPKKGGSDRCDWNWWVFEW